jgi:transposase
MAKNLLAVHDVNEVSRAELVRPSVLDAKLGELTVAWALCAIGMEACSDSPLWARQLQAFDHAVRLMAPRLAAPYRLSGNLGKDAFSDA